MSCKTSHKHDNILRTIFCTIKESVTLLFKVTILPKKFILKEEKRNEQYVISRCFSRLGKNWGWSLSRRMLFKVREELGMEFELEDDFQG